MPFISWSFIPAAHKLVRRRNASYWILRLCFVIIGVLISHASEAGPMASPTNGGWMATLQEHLTQCAPREKRAIRETMQRIEERLAR
jgi:hypothetical protein